MPVFRLNKLVRDGLRTEYDRMGQVAVYRTLTQLEHVRELQHKIKEEAGEIPLNGPHDEVVSELADVQQALDDVAELYGITSRQINDVKQKKFDKKGGFQQATYVETLEISDDDEWLDYYRSSPDRFIEISTSDDGATVLDNGLYQHYKGNRYLVTGIARHTETEELLVIYKPEHEKGAGKFWVRPLDMFTDVVTVDGVSIPRFERIYE